MLLHQSLAALGLNFLNVCDVHERGYYLALRKRLSVNDVCYFDLVFANAFYVEFCPISQCDVVPHRSERLNYAVFACSLRRNLPSLHEWTRLYILVYLLHPCDSACT